MSSLRLTETSYIVLGLLEQCGTATPYDLKGLAQVSVFNFWSVPHTQLYTECTRLSEAGLLSERRESEGRRRRFYSLTAAGRETLGNWRARPTDELYELRDPGLLKLFFGADPSLLAGSQLEAHVRRLEQYERLLVGAAEMPLGMRLALESGIGHEREFIRFWKALNPEIP